MFKKRFLSVFIIAMLLLLAACSSGSTTVSKTPQKEKPAAPPKELILATTTSTQDSGLLDELLPIFEEKYNAKVKTIAVGTGQALEMGKKGEADVLLTHAPASEQELVDSGDVTNYKRVMYNDFIVVGPSSDPAGVKGLPTGEAFKKLFDSKAIFVTRGDDSGTHKKELGIWEKQSITPAGDNYVSTGQGMGPTLQIASEKQGYTLTDRATYLAQEKNLKDVVIIVEGDKDLQNVYHVMQVNPDKNDKINSEGAKQFVEFMIADDTQNTIEEFGKKEYGQSLFFKYTE
ncbi:tungsten ABC transporter substrate-binding protein [Neobacillus notoginsengisoli]|uniref:Tungsten ABC transporter substrate-binding protein n=1 Tax=Neobacillus notoginsengisoli TaxID=1578198 RepID=A0A417YSS8_9BACI|nr:substrate-binding domain-containing protein [Neobacillus notoginsengisoli]RHW39010.1 tungsten ABC transporter substrate-binding protein [Neobacillus notoginsengisoli]